MPGRIPLFVSGDLHAIGYGRMRRTGGIDLSANPVNVILAGTLGSGTSWPSGGRGMIPQVPNGLEVDEAIPAIEQNGFIIADFLPDRISVRFFRWDRRTQTAADMETLVPFRTIELRRPSRPAVT